MRRLMLFVKQIWDVRFDGVLLLTGDQFVHVLTRDLEIIAAYRLQNDDLYTGAAVADGTIAVGGKAQYVHILTPSGLQASLPLHGSVIDSVYSRNGFIFSCSADPESAVKVSFAGQTLLLCPRAHEHCMDVTATDSEVISVGVDGQIKIWEFDYCGFYSQYYTHPGASTGEVRDLEQQWAAHLQATAYRTCLPARQPPMLLKYQAEWVLRLKQPLDSVYAVENIVVAHSPQIGFIFVYFDIYLQFDTSDTLAKQYSGAAVVAIEVPLRDVFWFRARGFQHVVATGGRNRAWACVFPTAAAVAACASQQDLQALFELRSYELPSGLYRAVTPVGGAEIVACGARKDGCVVVSTGEYAVVSAELVECIDDVFWTPRYRAYISGQSEWSWHPGNGVSIAKQ